MQIELTQSGDLLNERGELSQPGWAKDLILNYNRSFIKASKLRIKEWDYYCIVSPDYGAAFTIADNGYMGLLSVSILDFVNKSEITKSIMIPFTMGNLKMPCTSKEGNVKFKNSKISMEFLREKDCRILSVDFPAFTSQKSLRGTIKLTQDEKVDSMVIATPFKEDRHAFYYNQKINCLPAEGSLQFGDKTISFSPDNSFGVLDWGRGVWTYSNTWYWGSASGFVDDVSFGFNIGYGFGDTSKASENMIFYNNTSSKLDRVTFNIPEDSYLRPWTFSSSDGRFEMKFNPIIDRYSKTDFIILKSVQHQVFGRFTGRTVLDDGREIYIKDFLGFAEKVINKW